MQVSSGGKYLNAQNAEHWDYQIDKARIFIFRMQTIDGFKAEKGTKSTKGYKKYQRVLNAVT